MTTKEAQMREIGTKIFQLIEDKFYGGEKIEVTFLFEDNGEFELEMYCHDSYKIGLEDDD